MCARRYGPKRLDAPLRRRRPIPYGASSRSGPQRGTNDGLTRTTRGACVKTDASGAASVTVAGATRDGTPDESSIPSKKGLIFQISAMRRWNDLLSRDSSSRTLHLNDVLPDNRHPDGLSRSSYPPHRACHCRDRRTLQLAARHGRRGRGGRQDQRTHMPKD